MHSLCRLVRHDRAHCAWKMCAAISQLHWKMNKSDLTMRQLTALWWYAIGTGPFESILIAKLARHTHTHNLSHCAYAVFITYDLYDTSRFVTYSVRTTCCNLCIGGYYVVHYQRRSDCVEICRWRYFIYHFIILPVVCKNLYYK